MRIQPAERRGERKVRQKVATAAMAIGVVLFGITVAPGVASAHNFDYAFDCDGLTWSALLYDSAQTNSIVVRVDNGVVHSDANFGASDVGSVTWDQTVDHTWSIVIDAPGTEFDHNVSDVQTACTPPPPSSSTTTTTTTSTTTTQPEVTPTTTADETTTTAAEESTATTVEQAGPTTTASVGQQGPTSSVDQSSGAATTQAVGGSLPATGSDSSTSLIVIALTLVGVGAVMLRLTSRPTR